LCAPDGGLDPAGVPTGAAPGRPRAKPSSRDRRRRDPSVGLFTVGLLNGSNVYVLAVTEHGTRRIQFWAHRRTSGPVEGSSAPGVLTVRRSALRARTAQGRAVTPVPHPAASQDQVREQAPVGRDFASNGSSSPRTTPTRDTRPPATATTGAVTSPSRTPCVPVRLPRRASPSGQAACPRRCPHGIRTIRTVRRPYIGGCPPGTAFLPPGEVIDVRLEEVQDLSPPRIDAHWPAGP